jgi:hypothetical protein
MNTHPKQSFRRTVAKTIRTLQRAPEERKQRIVVTSSVIFGACAVTVWVLLFSASVGSVNAENATAQSSTNTQTRGIGGRFSDGFASIIDTAKESYERASTYTETQARTLTTLIESPNEISVENTLELAPQQP